MVVFAPKLAGRVIRPLDDLPPLKDSRTVLNGDIDGDGRPDVALHGKLTSGLHGLEVCANNCTVRGLAIAGFPGCGVRLDKADGATIQSCHIGVNLAGTKAVPNGESGIYLTECDDCLIGGTAPNEGNVVSSGGLSYGNSGVRSWLCESMTVAGNRLGITRDGTTALGYGWGGLFMEGGAGHLIGGTTPGARNLFGGLFVGASLVGIEDSVVAGNYFGLAADGNALLPVFRAIHFRGSARRNTIGGTVSGARNVFAGVEFAGVTFADVGTEDNKVQGNYFGTNAAGTRQRPMMTGVLLEMQTIGKAGAQVIGGDAPGAGNYFAQKPYTGAYAQGVEFQGSGDGTIVSHNTFGVRPDGRSAPGLYHGVNVYESSPVITDNLFAGMTHGVIVRYAPANPLVLRNTFRNCDSAVYVEEYARCRLGNLGNASAADDGGNLFRSSNAWFIRNLTPFLVKAEGNGFGTTSRDAIEAKVWDRRDDSTYGRVDYNPLIGGVVPTEAVLAITGASSLATVGGAEIVFTLSAAADVTVSVLNLAGRPVATVAQETACEAGIQRLVWSGLTAHGTSAPAGTYLARIMARGDGGAVAQAIVPLRIGR